MKHFLILICVSQLLSCGHELEARYARAIYNGNKVGFELANDSGKVIFTSGAIYDDVAINAQTGAGEQARNPNITGKNPRQSATICEICVNG